MPRRLSVTRYRYNAAQVLPEILRDEQSDGNDSGDCAEIVGLTFALSSTVSEILPVLYDKLIGVKPLILAWYHACVVIRFLSYLL